jgi:N-acyl-D-amino-acid deacylase
MAEGEEPGLASLVIEDGVIREIIHGDIENAEHKFPQDTRIYDATGMLVAPGFVDIHIHDEYSGGAPVVQRAMLSQGVTAGLSGNCGSGPLFPDSAALHPHPMVNLYYLVGNCVLRAKAGQFDRYLPATNEQIGVMRDLLRESMELGAMGVSLGLEYEPGASPEEVDALAAVVAEYDGFISAHIRFDDKRCIDAVQEVISISRKHDVRVQVSHLASMTSFHTGKCVDLITSASAQGFKVTFDCYPYAAFCTNIGSAVFDDGFYERWGNKGPENLEAVSGKFRGQRLDWESFKEMRRDEPNGLVVAHIMNMDEVEACIANPNCIIASDTFYAGEGIHPRTYGTFPKALSILRRHGYNWNDALKKVTTAPADAMRIKSGRLRPGGTADVVIFDSENFEDRATYQDPFKPPTGVKLVMVNGQVALDGGKLSSIPYGSFCKRP